MYVCACVNFMCVRMYVLRVIACEFYMCVCVKLLVFTHGHYFLVMYISLFSSRKMLEPKLYCSLAGHEMEWFVLLFVVLMMDVNFGIC